MKTKRWFAVWLSLFLSVSLIFSGCAGRAESAVSSASPAVTDASAGTLTPETRSQETEKQTASETAGSTGADEAKSTEAKSTEAKSTEAEITEEASTADPMTLVTSTAYCMASALNVRIGEGTEYDSLGVFSENEQIPVIAYGESGWVQVVFEGKIGYVFSEYVTDDPDWLSKRESESTAGYESGALVYLEDSWTYAGFSQIHSGAAVMYRAEENRKNIVIGVNAGHGTSGGGSYQTYSHPDMSPKVTGGTNASGAVMSTAVSSGMDFSDGTPEKSVTLEAARMLRDTLLSMGFDVLMIRDSEDVQLDNVARTVICNNAADCHIALHWDGDGLSYDKGCFFMSVPDGIKYMEPVSYTWEKSEALGNCLIEGLRNAGNTIFDCGSVDQDLTQTSYSSVPSVDIELGNQSSDHSEETLRRLVSGLAAGIAAYYGY